MSFYLLHESTGRKFIRPTWMKARDVINDISELNEKFHVEYLDGLLLCGRGQRYTLRYRHGQIELVFHSKDFTKTYHL